METFWPEALFPLSHLTCPVVIPPRMGRRKGDSASQIRSPLAGRCNPQAGFAANKRTCPEAPTSQGYLPRRPQLAFRPLRAELGFSNLSRLTRPGLGPN
jgi:hypothetical protein